MKCTSLFPALSINITIASPFERGSIIIQQECLPGCHSTRRREPSRISSYAGSASRRSVGECFNPLLIVFFRHFTAKRVTHIGRAFVYKNNWLSPNSIDLFAWECPRFATLSASSRSPGAVCWSKLNRHDGLCEMNLEWMHLREAVRQVPPSYIFFFTPFSWRLYRRGCWGLINAPRVTTMRKVRLSFRLTGTIAVGRSRGNDNVMLCVTIGVAEKFGK